MQCGIWPRPSHLRWGDYLRQGDRIPSPFSPLPSHPSFPLPFPPFLSLTWGQHRLPGLQQVVGVQQRGQRVQHRGKQGVEGEQRRERGVEDEALGEDLDLGSGGKGMG